MYPQISTVSKTEFSVRTLVSERDTKLARNTDVVITLVPSLGDRKSVMSNSFSPIPWKILTFPAYSTTYRSVTIHSEIAVCTVKEKENGVLIPQLSEILTKGGEIVLKLAQKEGGLYWELAFPPPPHIEKNVHDSNRSITGEPVYVSTDFGDKHGDRRVTVASDVLQQTARTQTTPAFAKDNFIIKNEYEDTRLALCLTEEDGQRLLIVDLGTLPKNKRFTISGPLYLQAYSMAEQMVGKPLDLTDCAPLLGPMAIVDLPESAFILYTKRNGSTMLKQP
ncbi:uncharacterized protein F5147DRAFT_707155 [Suillus discolor]|uniref:Uncharacterized protein n=1 Tax=Suillus discolor TaxID=1912936 RepID=A0A9P7F121_9AGAM|nr:uncharacterized protein F5147DRAFT_707155 [Suillus discolor]KAG2102496.1 hypothetical protein F5147DRAFT_707155 [Suillus discolor]